MSLNRVNPMSGSNNKLANQIDKSSVQTDASPQKSVQYIAEAAATDEVCIPLSDGRKKSIVSHDDPESHITHEEVVGNYGLMAKGEVVYIDVDDPEEFPRTRDGFNWVQDSVHGDGFHVAVASSVEVSNSKEVWGEVRAENQYIVGPGSEVDHDSSERCDGEPCSGIGTYEMASAGPLDLVGEGFWEALSVGVEPSVTVEELPETEIDTSGVEFDIQNRVRKAKNSKHGDHFTALWEGRYRDADYNDDSDAEMDLAIRLAFWMKENESAIRDALNMACKEHPRSQNGGVRKWAERTDIYRDITVKKAVQEVDEVYEGGSTSLCLPYEMKPDVSYPTYERVLDAVRELGPATTTELLEHEHVDRSQRQVQRALKKLEDDGAVSWEKDGRAPVYYTNT